MAFRNLSFSQLSMRLLPKFNVVKLVKFGVTGTLLY